MGNISIDSFHFYFLMAALQGVILAFIIIFQKPKRFPNIFFGILIAQFSLALLNLVLEERIHAFNALFPIPLSYGMALGPLAYFHVKTMSSPKFIFNKKIAIHFLPALLFEFIFSTLFFTYCRFHMDWAEANVNTINFIFLIQALLTMLHMFIYSYYTYGVIKNSIFKPEDIGIKIRKWLRQFSVFGLLILVFLAGTIFISIFNLDKVADGARIRHPLSALLCIVIYWLGYQYLLKHSSVVYNYLTRLSGMRYSDQEVIARKKQLSTLLNDKEVYKNKSLSVQELAKDMGWPVRDVSFIIGEAFDTNFNDLINRYRINAFKNAITKNEHKKYSILGIAEEVGFSSKASFYRAFKKECGQTPSEFLASKYPK